MKREREKWSNWKFANTTTKQKIRPPVNLDNSWYIRREGSGIEIWGNKYLEKTLGRKGSTCPTIQYTHCHPGSREVSHVTYVNERRESCTRYSPLLGFTGKELPDNIKSQMKEVYSNWNKQFGIARI